MSKQAARTTRWGFVLRGAGPFYARCDFNKTFKVGAVELFLFEHDGRQYGFVQLEKKVRMGWWGGVMKALRAENGTEVEEVFPLKERKKDEEVHGRVKEFMDALGQMSSKEGVPEAVLRLADAKIAKEPRSALEWRLRVAEARIKELEARLGGA